MTAQADTSLTAARQWVPTRLKTIAGQRAFGRTCIALIVAATVALVLLASVPGSSFAGTVPPGSRAPFLSDAARSIGLDHLVPSRTFVLAYALTALACAGFVGVLLASHHGGVSTRSVVGWSIVLIALTTLGPPLFSHDLYLYAVYGRMWVFHHANPYVQTPSVSPQDPFFSFTPWHHLRSLYGHVFTLISGALVWVFRSPAASVAAFKVLAGACWVATVLLAARLARRHVPTRTCFAAAVIGLNPVVIFRIVAGGHNDAIVAGGHNDAIVALCIMAALTAWYDARPLVVTLLLTIGMLVKFVTVIPLIIFFVVAIRQQRTTRNRLLTLSKHAAIVVGLTVIALLPFGYTPRVLSSFLTVTSISGGSLRPPEVELSARFDSLLRHAGLSHHVALSNDLMRGLFLAVALIAFLLLLRNDARPVAERVLLALLIFLLCSQYLQPWYLAWFVPLVGFVTKRMVVAIAVALSLLASESLVTLDTSGLVLHSLARLSYDLYPILALAFLVLLPIEVVRPNRVRGALPGDGPTPPNEPKDRRRSEVGHTWSSEEHRSSPATERQSTKAGNDSMRTDRP